MAAGWGFRLNSLPWTCHLPPEACPKVGSYLETILFFRKTTSPGPMDMLRNDFEFSKIFLESDVSILDFRVYRKSHEGKVYEKIPP